jgi:hypothetical protein
MAKLYFQLASMLPYANFMSNEYELESDTEHNANQIITETGDDIVMEDGSTYLITEEL